jgi:hypothetical protein
VVTLLLSQVRASSWRNILRWVTFGIVFAVHKTVFFEIGVVFDAPLLAELLPTYDLLSFSSLLFEGKILYWLFLLWVGLLVGSSGVFLFGFRSIAYPGRGRLVDLLINRRRS